MKHIIIDTNVVHWDYFLKGTNITTLCSTELRLGHRVYMPKVVVDEIVRQYEEDAEEQCRLFNK